MADFHKNYKELNMKENISKNKVWQIIGVAVLCAVCVLTAVLGIVFGMNHSSEDLNVSKDMASDIDNGVLHDTTVRLLSGVATTASDGSVSQTITAVISPADASNKMVDWSVAWVDGTPLANAKIGDYISVAPSSDGALTATVTCKKAFRGSVAFIKVVTREGGYVATCNVSFEGKPSSLQINGGNSGKANYQGSNTYTVALENVFSDVGDSFYSSLKVKSYTWGGTFYGGTFNTATQQWTDMNTYNISDLSLMSEYISVSYANKKLTVSNKNSLIGAFASQSSSSQGAIYTQRVQKDVDMYVDVTLESAGVEKTIRVDFENVTISANGGKNGSCKLLNSATFDVTIGNIFGTFDKPVTIQSFTWGGTYTGQNWYNNPSGNGYTGDKKTCNVSDLKQRVSDYFDVTISGKKVTVNNKKSMLTHSLNTGSVSGGYNVTYYNCPVANLNVYLDIVLACGDSTATFRVSFTSGVNSVSLSQSTITF